MDKIIAAWNALVRFARPDVDAIIAAFVKASSKLEVYIERELKQTQRETDYIASLITSREARNAAIDRAYRVIHKLDGITR